MSAVATTAERSRAKRLRRALRRGVVLAPDDAAWLDAYTSARAGSGSAERATEVILPSVAAEPAPTPDAPRADASRTDPPIGEAEQMPSGASPPDLRIIHGGKADDWAPVKFGPPGTSSATPLAPTAPPPSAAPLAACNVENCPECKMVRGAKTCGTTGKLVWPPMSPEGAEGMARAFFFGFRAFYKWLRKKDAPPATDDDVRKLGKALAEIAYRRASVIGSFDDVFMLVGACVAYGAKVMAAEASERASANVKGAA